MEWILFHYLQFLTAFQGRYGHHQRWPSGCSGWVVVGVPVWRSWTRAQSLCRTKSYPFKRCLIQTFIFFLANTEWCEIWSSFLRSEISFSPEKAMSGLEWTPEERWRVDWESSRDLGSFPVLSNQPWLKVIIYSAPRLPDLLPTPRCLKA